LTAESAEESEAPERPRVLHPRPLPAPLRVALVPILAALLALVGWLAAIHYPRLAPPQGTELERRIAGVFGVPRGRVDDRVVGDYLVERFYAMDVETGERYIADVLKGRITGILSTPQGAGSAAYTFLLDLRTLQRDRALYSAFVDTVARPDTSGASYLGLRVLPGDDDSFPVNYDGQLPYRYQPFTGPNGERIYAFLRTKTLKQVESAPGIQRAGAYSYLLSSSDNFPFLRVEFGLRAVVLSELLVVDATGRAQSDTLFQLLQEYPRGSSR
jgi:hypothetical protein